MKIRLTARDIQEITDYRKASNARGLSAHTGVQLFQESPKALQDIVKAVIRAQEGHDQITKLRNDQFIHLQNRILKILTENIDRQTQKEKAQNTRIIEAFIKTKHNQTVLQEQHKLFSSVEGNIRQHQQSAKENNSKIMELQAQLKRGMTLSLVEQRNKVNEILQLIKKQEELKRQNQLLKPDQRTVNNAYLSFIKSGDEKGLKALKENGYQPDASTRQKLSGELVKGKFFKNTISIGSLVDLGKELLRDLKNTATELLTDGQKDTALKDPDIASKQERAAAKATNPTPSRTPIYIESEGRKPVNEVSGQIEQIALKYGLKVDLSMAFNQPGQAVGNAKNQSINLS